MLTRIEETFCNKHSPIAVTGTYVFRKHGPSPSGKNKVEKYHIIDAKSYHRPQPSHIIGGFRGFSEIRQIFFRFFSF